MTGSRKGNDWDHRQRQVDAIEAREAAEEIAPTLVVWDVDSATFIQAAEPEEAPPTDAPTPPEPRETEG